MAKLDCQTKATARAVKSGPHLGLYAHSLHIPPPAPNRASGNIVDETSLLGYNEENKPPGNRAEEDIMKQFTRFPRAGSVLQILGTLLWLIILRNASGFRAPYLLVGGIGLYSQIKGSPCLSSREFLWSWIGGGIFSFAVTLANYNLFSHFLTGLGCFVLGSVIGESIFAWLTAKCGTGWKENTAKWKPWMVFAFCMGFIAAVDLTILYNCYYPGVLSYDSIWQMAQLVENVYSNHHPYYHTQIIRIIYQLGMLLTGDPNRSIFFYNVFQILTMSAIFSHVLTTLYQRKIPLIFLLTGLLWYAFAPFHVMYSFTVWKDVLFGGVVVLFLTELYRRLCGMDRSSGFLLALSGLGFCLLRSNGWAAFALLTLVFLIFFGKEYPRLAVLFLGLLALSWWMKGPVLEDLNVIPPDTIESLSIPAQQVARVVDEGLPLTPEQAQLIDQIADIDQIPDNYVSYLSDPIKELVRATGDQQLLVTRKSDYIRLWLELGMTYPQTYIKAWVDQTKGYWNGGYEYWIWADFVFSNNLGLRMHVHRPGLQALWQHYLELFTGPVFSLVVSIGLHVWIVAAACVVGIGRKRWKAAFLAIPLLAVIASLMVATPVFAEFRYAYCIFTCMPVILASLFDKAKL